jgi:hypothetical protein
MNAIEQEGSVPQNSSHAGSTDVVQWTASEYIQHQKPTGWYGLTVFFTVAISVIMYLILHDFFAPVLFALIGASLFLYGHRQPETLTYSVGPNGVGIGNKRHGLDDFRSFSMLDDDGILTIQLNPLKRFMPAISLYLDPKDADRVANAFALHLPHEDRSIEFVDRIARKLRF